jgi:hypothetical protein
MSRSAIRSRLLAAVGDVAIPGVTREQIADLILAVVLETRAKADPC